MNYYEELVKELKEFNEDYQTIRMNGEVKDMIDSNVDSIEEIVLSFNDTSSMIDLSLKLGQILMYIRNIKQLTNPIYQNTFYPSIDCYKAQNRIGNILRNYSKVNSSHIYIVLSQKMNIKKFQTYLEIMDLIDKLYKQSKTITMDNEKIQEYELIKALKKKIRKMHKMVSKDSHMDVDYLIRTLLIRTEEISKLLQGILTTYHIDQHKEFSQIVKHLNDIGEQIKIINNSKDEYK